MRHRNAHRRLGRNSAHRRSMLRNIVTSFFKHEKVETTVARAKEMRSIAESLITKSKTDDVHHRRMVGSYVKDKSVVTKLFTDIGARYKDRPGGFTRIVLTRRRAGDNAEMAVIELV